MKNAEMIIRNIWSRNDAYSNHRIPGIFVTSRSTVIIYNEARREGSDWALMDIFMQRSENHGEAFGEPIYLAHGNDTWHTVNNPVMMEDKNGRLHLLYCRDYTIRNGGAWHIYSDDDGLTWSEPQNITYATAPELHNVFAFGPGHGICTSDGTLLVPIWMVLKEAGAEYDSHTPSVISTVYSRDCGETWQMGEIIYPTEEVQSPNETVAVELPDGRVMLDIRSFAKCRSKAYSPNGYADWTTPVNDTALPDPACFGSIALYRGLNGADSLLSVNCANDTTRQMVTLKVSTDNGDTWPLTRTIDVERGGYCDIAVDEKNEKIYILYEDKFGKDVYLARLNPEWMF